MPVVLHINRLIFDRKKSKANYPKDTYPRDIKNIIMDTRRIRKRIYYINEIM